jgi:signal transduction histidine kinase
MIAISDNGLGLPDNLDLTSLTSDGHYGLIGISERVSLLGGRMHLEKSEPGGTVLMVEIPHPRVEVKRKTDK